MISLKGKSNIKILQLLLASADLTQVNPPGFRPTMTSAEGAGYLYRPEEPDQPQDKASGRTTKATVPKQGGNASTCHRPRVSAASWCTQPKTPSLELLDRSHPTHQLVLPQPWGPELPQRLIGEACDVLFHLVGGPLAWISDSIEALLGLNPEERHNRSLDLLTDPSEPAGLQALVAAATGQQVKAETHLRHRDGHWR